MRLVIAEKELVATAIAKTLGNAKKFPGYFQCGSDKVTWTNGHALALCDPEDYDEQFKKWVLDHLPVAHVPWKYKVIPQKSKQLKIIKDLLGEATSVVHAGDTDAEGQLLIDEVLEYYRVRLPVKRVLITNNNPKMVARAFANLKDNREFQGLSQSALARSVGDQYYGYNMTRLYTLMAQALGYKGTLSIGRVQTAILGLIVRRDRAVETFKPHPYFLLKGHFSFGTDNIDAMLKVPEDAPVDAEGRLIDRDWMARVQRECTNHAAEIMSAETTEETEQHPLPYDLLQLQADVSSKYGIDPDKTTAITQALRDKYNLITYNRSDCRYLNEVDHDDAPNVIASVTANVAHLVDDSMRAALAGVDLKIKSRAFNSANVKVHHGIIPTEDLKNVMELTADERNIYLMIVRQYLAQFWPLKKMNVTKVVIGCAGYTFTVGGTIVTDPGWSALFASESGRVAATDEDAMDDGEDNADSRAVNLQTLKRLRVGDQGSCTKADILERVTKPPKYYTMRSLMLDLRNVAKYASPEIAKLLRDKDKGKAGENGGIGTAATRATFVPTLIERNFVEKKRGKIVSTTLGRNFHDTLPAYATNVDMTALWHEQQVDIEHGRGTAVEFVQRLIQSLTDHIAEVKAKGLPKFKLPDATAKKPADTTEFPCRACGKLLVRRVSAAKRATKTTPAKPATVWYGCSGYPACKQTYFDKDGSPKYEVGAGSNTTSSANKKPHKAGDSCPDCNKGVLCKKTIEQGKNAGKHFLGCNTFPSCRFFQWASQT